MSMTMIFSVDRTTKFGKSPRNDYYRDMTMGLLNAASINYNLAKGCYKEDGQDEFTEELSFYCTELTNAQGNLIRVIAKASKQDSVLYKNNGFCFLGFKADDYQVLGDKNCIGSWTEVPKDEAIASGCYTHMNQKYYIAK